MDLFKNGHTFLFLLLPVCSWFKSLFDVFFNIFKNIYAAIEFCTFNFY